MQTLTVRKIGNSYGVILPQEVLSQLGVQEGDKLSLTPASGGFEVRPADSDFGRAMKIATEGMERYRNTLRELAK